MRPVYLIPLAAMMMVVAGCGSGGKEPAALSSRHRDLTLATQAPELKVASPVELGTLRAQPRTASHTRIVRRKPIPRPIPVADRFTPSPSAVTVVPTVVLTVARPVAEPAAEPASDRELLPGKTVSVIPASSGPSTGAEGTDEFPTIRRGFGGSGMGGGWTGGGGSGMGGRGRCPGRGPGIAAAPRPDFR